LNGEETTLLSVEASESIVPVPAEPSITEDIRTTGPYIVDVSFSRPMRQLSKALDSIGFSSLVLDPRSTENRARFLAHLRRNTRFVDTEYVRWDVLQPTSFDPFGDVVEELRTFEVATEKIYVVSFLARMRSHPDHNAVLSELMKIGLEVSHLFMVRRNPTVPERPNVSMKRWCALGKWKKHDAYLGDEDPFFFEHVELVEKP
jgi:hypothetical protein